MADQQSSSSSTSFTYDAFLTFLGSDIRSSFTDNLCKKLSEKGINTFIDDQKVLISEGDETKSSLFNVINHSRIAIIVFSINYASSSFCLEECAYIVDKFKQQNHQFEFFPVFYNISATIVRKQVGSYKIAFEKHEEMLKENKEKVAKWRKALVIAASISGWHFELGDGYESYDEFKIINNIVEQVSRRFDRVPLHNILDVVPEVSQTSQSALDVSQTDHEVAKVKMPISHWDFKAEMAWRVVGLMSSVVGLLCYALSPSFNRLIGRWKPFKVFLYAVSSLFIFTTVLFAKQSSLSTQHAQLIKTCAIFVVLMIISAYSFVYDRAVNGKPDILSVVSNAAFALVSLCLHKLFKLKSEMGIFSYFLCCFTVQLLTINWMLIFVAIIYGGLLFVMHSQSQPSRGQRSHSELAAGSGGQHVIALPP